MTLRDRVDPELREGLDQYLAFAGPGGLNAIPDLQERRARRTALRQAAKALQPPNDRVRIEDRSVPGPQGAPDVPLRVYRPVAETRRLPALYYIHGGGMVLGVPEDEDVFASLFAEAVGCVVVSVGYRLAPEHPDPAPVEDCYAGLVWTAGHAGDLGIDPDRIAVGGPSAGGGLSAATALLARDRGGPRLVYQLLVYPMLDDRNVTPSSREITDLGVWDRDGNVEAWSWVLPGRAGTDDVSVYAAPARATDLTGLPPAFVDTGELDLFRDEDLAYATRLLQAGVPTEVHVYPGAYHAFEALAPLARVSERAMANRIGALRRALHPEQVPPIPEQEPFPVSPPL
jgi:acetyl esterase/lipase